MNKEEQKESDKEKKKMKKMDHRLINKYPNKLYKQGYFWTPRHGHGNTVMQIHVSWRASGCVRVSMNEYESECEWEYK